MSASKGDTLTKNCGRCRQLLSVAEFYPNRARSDGISGYCVKCSRSLNSDRRPRLREQVVDHLGGRCSSDDCGVPGGMTDIRALQIDHVEGGGTVERSLLGAGEKFLRSVLTAPAGKYQLLCANCNAIKRIEQQEHGQKTRTPPTERHLLRSNPEWQEAHGERTRRYWADHPGELVKRNQRISASKKAG